MIQWCCHSFVRRIQFGCSHQHLYTQPEVNVNIILQEQLANVLQVCSQSSVRLHSLTSAYNKENTVIDESLNACQI